MLEAKGKKRIITKYPKVVVPLVCCTKLTSIDEWVEQSKPTFISPSRKSYCPGAQNLWLETDKRRAWISKVLEPLATEGSIWCGDPKVAVSLFS